MDNVSLFINIFVVILSVVSVFSACYSVFSKAQSIKLKNYDDSVKTANKKRKFFDFAIRVCDVVFASVALILLIPIFVILFITLKSTLKESAIVKLKKLGKNGKQIEIFAFRTDSNNGLDSLNVFLNQTGLKNLPQLLNVLKGDLSIYGLAQMNIETFKAAKEEIPEFDCVYDYYRPGIVSLSLLETKTNNESYFVFLNQSNVRFINNRGFKLMFEMTKQTLNLVFRT